MRKVKKKRNILAILLISIFFITVNGSALSAAEGVVLNTGTADRGYVSVKITKSTSKKLRVKITKGDKSYTYAVDTREEYKLPLQMGNGAYSVKVLENIEGNKYATLESADVTASISDPMAPYKISHMLIDYEHAPKTTGAAKNITAGASNDLLKLEDVYANVVETIKYNHTLASQITSGTVTTYVPEIDAVYTSGQGICFDYSAVMASMLRSQGIPTRMVFGYVAPKNIYHAWNEVYITTAGWVKVRGEVPIGSNDWSRMDATFAAASSSGGVMSSFIGNGSNYRATDFY
ncbi:MAG: transglutaminase-like domain-containing protein [Syntrophomonadaceae bacterium]|jgi:transglutaminase/protease-like cytokinesis protein 3|nr:transglutaminase-like domain-containing protein [Syntrophomonadaceae bacterium]